MEEFGEVLRHWRLKGAADCDQLETEIESKQQKTKIKTKQPPLASHEKRGISDLYGLKYYYYYILMESAIEHYYYRIMDKITITEAGRSLLDLQPSISTPPSAHLPPLHHLHLNTSHLDSKSMLKHSSKGKLDVAALRTILRDETIAEVNKLKEQTNQRAYRYVKQELMRDITANKQFLGAKAETMARRMLGEQRAGVSLQTEIGKGKNYLNKLVGEYDSRRGEEERIKARLRERVKVTL